MTSPKQIQLENIAESDYEIFALLKQRYSPRTFKDVRVKKQHLNQLFEAARWSPSCNNIQPWRFIYAEKNSEAYQNIISCLSDFNKEWVVNAPLLMITAYEKKTEDHKDNFHALHDLGLAIGNMTTQAQYMGIAMHQMAGLDWQQAEKLFNVPENYHITSAIALGYYGGELDKLSPELQKAELKERQRIDQSQFAFMDSWKTIKHDDD
ncbi:nitroreductase family protein [Cellulophaga sp. E16_2]|uniref:Nitroreductase n=1 Tax=Cellulophaga algicola (strain DSM 14237 / IC166 / ACAM 630) TaxID=688270 RepID=E6XE48_CELAD|nr:MULTISPECIES: nitroreductase family protein [Cellulophaga]ADV49129.1 nitroreductase [Cellulophaga algicola DSM 14237]MBO0591576.1 nitroreductase family protein [Cellulophaga sp. E16_2]